MSRLPTKTTGMTIAPMARLAGVSTKRTKQWALSCTKGLSTDIVCEVKKIFTDLTDDELLKKCLHGTTQNRNESFNAMIWERILKVTCWFEPFSIWCL